MWFVVWVSVIVVVLALCNVPNNNDEESLIQHTAPKRLTTNVDDMRFSGGTIW